MHAHPSTNYFKYFERGRTEFLRVLGVSISGLKADGVEFVVRRAEVEYLRPCRYDDLITLSTSLSGSTGATITFEHVMEKEGVGCARGTVVLAATGRDGRPCRVQEIVRAAIKETRGRS